MAYLLPRVLFVLIVWAMSCVLIRNLWPDADRTVFGVVGLVWVFGGIGYFSYSQKLRRDIEELERRRYGIPRAAALRAIESPAAE
jgi:glucose uptake protein GlcU